MKFENERCAVYGRNSTVILPSHLGIEQLTTCRHFESEFRLGHLARNGRVLIINSLSTGRTPEHKWMDSPVPVTAWSRTLGGPFSKGPSAEKGGIATPKLITFVPPVPTALLLPFYPELLTSILHHSRPTFFPYY